MLANKIVLISNSSQSVSSIVVELFSSPQFGSKGLCKSCSVLFALSHVPVVHSCAFPKKIHITSSTWLDQSQKQIYPVLSNDVVLASPVPVALILIIFSLQYAVFNKLAKWQEDRIVHRQCRSGDIFIHEWHANTLHDITKMCRWTWRNLQIFSMDILNIMNFLANTDPIAQKLIVKK